LLVLVLASGALAIACDKKQDAPPAPPPPAPVAAVPSAPAPAVAPSGKMAHCPSTVAGASTTIEDAPGGVALTITGKDDATTAEIRARAQFLAQSAKNGPSTVQHNGSGEGGGVFGRCPIVMRNTTLVVTDATGGTKIVVTPENAKEQDWLRRESRSRLAELTLPGAEGAGAGKMANCPSAVKGALTSVVDAKGTVQVTITAKDDGAVKQIRDRAQHIVAASKVGAKQAKHDGHGDGGGTIGRCPVVLKDTLVDAKDAPGGTVFTVKPADMKNLEALDKEVRDRTAKFALAE
jgi:hypothetical protein